MSGWLRRGRRTPASNDAPTQRKSLPEPPPEEMAALQPLPGKTNGGREEEKFLDRGLEIDELEHEAQVAEYNRSKKFRNHFEWLALRTMDALFAMLGILGTVWVLHLILPEKRRWLTPDQVIIIQDILTGGLIAGLLADHFKRRMGK